MSKKQTYAKIIGRRLSLFRSYFSLSQTDIADRLGCSQRYISQCESGTNLLSTQYLLKFHQEFNIPLNYFEPEEENIESFLKKATVNELVTVS